MNDFVKENEQPRTLSTPFSSGTHTFPPPPTVSSTPANAFDDFDAFDNLSEAKEADKSSDLDFSFSEPTTTDFNPAFDSPAASMTTAGMTSAQQTPTASRTFSQDNSANGFSTFQPSASTTSAFGAPSTTTSPIPATAQHDWDAIFSGLDSSKPVDTSLASTDPWGASEPSTSTSTFPAAPAIPSSSGGGKAERGGAITPGTEHDDPILKRLTGMGYPRGKALDALERFDYDINKVSFKFLIRGGRGER
jgi:epidermal growth factor receptor substrate 15